MGKFLLMQIYFVLQLAGPIVLLWAAITQWRRTRHWACIVLGIACGVQVVLSVGWFVFENFFLLDSAMEKTDKLRLEWAELRFRIMLWGGSISYLAAIIGGIGLIRKADKKRAAHDGEPPL